MLANHRLKHQTSRTSPLKERVRLHHFAQGHVKLKELSRSPVKSTVDPFFWHGNRLQPYFKINCTAIVAKLFWRLSIRLAWQRTSSRWCMKESFYHTYMWKIRKFEYGLALYTSLLMNTCQKFCNESLCVWYPPLLTSDYTETYETCIYQHHKAHERLSIVFSRYWKSIKNDRILKGARKTRCTTGSVSTEIGMTRSCPFHSDWTTNHRIELLTRERKRIALARGVANILSLHRFYVPMTNFSKKLAHTPMKMLIAPCKIDPTLRAQRSKPFKPLAREGEDNRVYKLRKSKELEMQI